MPALFALKTNKMSDISANCNLKVMLPPNVRNRSDADALIERACDLSRYARRVLAAEPDLFPRADVLTSYSADEMRASLAAAQIVDEITLKRALRELRKRVLVRTLTRDLGG